MAYEDLFWEITEEIEKLGIKEEFHAQLDKMRGQDKHRYKEIRDKCNISIESKRSEKVLGSSLEADILILLSKKDFDLVSNADFSEICITSSAELKQVDTQEIIIETSKATGSKCSLCWKIKKDKCLRQNCPV